MVLRTRLNEVRKGDMKICHRLDSSRQMAGMQGPMVGSESHGARAAHCSRGISLGSFGT